MRLLAFGVCVLVLAGCGSKPTPVELDTHFAAKASPDAEARIIKSFAPAGKLIWGPIRRQAIHREFQLGVPMSRVVGTDLWRDATVGSLTYRVKASYEGQTPKLVTISVRDGTEYPYGTRDADIVARFKVSPGLLSAFKGTTGFVRFGGETYSVSSEFYDSKQETHLECVYEFRP